MAFRPPDAFLSYTRFDNQHDGGAISEFRERLASAVRAVTGEPFEIFQDIDGIGLGEPWAEVLDEVLDRVRFFIPIITPSYFTSAPCRDELGKFLRAEAERGRSDLVLPIYYIDSDLLERADLRADDPLAQVIHERQRQDWRKLRFEPFESKAVRIALETLARGIARAPRIGGGAAPTSRHGAVGRGRAARRREWAIYEAAFLWHDLVPPPQQEHWALMSPSVSATKQMLHDAASRGELELAGEERYYRGDDCVGVTRWVARDELRRFAQSIGQRPKFLFPEEASPAPAGPGAASAGPDHLAVIRDHQLAPELVVLPRGEFMMGSTEAERSWAIEAGSRREWVNWETPQHRVVIGYRFALGRHAVTFEEWDRFATDEAWHRARHVTPYHPADQDWGRGRQPVVDLSWEDLQGYLRWLSDHTGQRYRLPSEAEWEYACRAGTTTSYHVGATLTRYDANFGRPVGRPVAVGSYAPNPWGLYDMHGNVLEWVEDCWNDSYQGAPADGSAWTSGDVSRRVLRGGSWAVHPRGARSACRDWGGTAVREARFGFRVARTL